MPSDLLQETFIEHLQTSGVHVTKKQCEQLEQYYHHLVTWNKKMNLTGITERREVYWKHFYDSLSLAFIVDFNECDQLMDVGSGAGFPALPLKIVFPHLRVTAVDSLRKRLTFLQELTDVLQLKDVQTVHARAELLGQDSAYREQFELVTARAVARLNVLCELCLPLTRIGGQFVAMKTANVQTEITEAEGAIIRLGGRLSDTKSFHLPNQLGGRSLVRIAKEKKTPAKYPRKPGTPAKHPIRV